jgi:hypothetical protein
MNSHPTSEYQTSDATSMDKVSPISPLHVPYPPGGRVIENFVSGVATK